MALASWEARPRSDEEKRLPSLEGRFEDHNLHYQGLGPGEKQARWEGSRLLAHPTLTQTHAHPESCKGHLRLEEGVMLGTQELSPLRSASVV